MSARPSGTIGSVTTEEGAHVPQDVLGDGLALRCLHEGSAAAREGVPGEQNPYDAMSSNKGTRFRAHFWLRGWQDGQEEEPAVEAT